MDTYEKLARSEGCSIIVGVDEVGRGPLAGPVLAASVVFTEALMGLGIKDSKKLTPKKRAVLEREIFKRSPAVGIGVLSNHYIDNSNILVASLKAMAMSVRALKDLDGALVVPDRILVDGQYTIKELDTPQSAIIKGDGLSVSIAAASIIAKTARDRIMVVLDSIYPGYNFAGNKGYGSREHMDAIALLGPTPVHRMSFSFGPADFRKAQKGGSVNA
jgi:ribonuclease HII